MTCPPRARGRIAPWTTASAPLEAAAGEAPHRVLPDGCIDVLFDGTPGARAVGPMTRAIVLQRVVAALDRRGAPPPSMPPDHPAPPWSALAADLGFADQAHLVRELGSLAGATPGDLLRERRAVSDFFKMGSAGAVTVPPSPVLSRRQEVPR